MWVPKAALWLAVLGPALGFAAAGAAQNRQDVVDALLGRSPPARVESKPKPKSKPKSSGKTASKSAAKAHRAKKPASAPKSAAKPAPKQAESEPAREPEAPHSNELPAEAPLAPPSTSARELPAPTPGAEAPAAMTPAPAALPGEPATAAPTMPAAPPASIEAELAPAASSAAPAEGTSAETATPATGLELAMYVDAYAAWQSSGSGTLATLSGHRAFSGQGSTFRAENGFSLAFVGIDVSYQLPRLGATASLRFGEAAPLYHAHADGESDFTFGVDLLSQAYVTWRPVEPLAIDLGMFSTPFGAEVLESWKNLNYTRGALYYYAQPAWHTGLRLSWDASEQWSLLGFIADGTNNVSETQQKSGLDQSPTIGAQLRYAPVPELSLALGGLFTLDSYHNDDAGYDAFGDFIATLELGGWKSAFNADYILTRQAAPDRHDRQFLGFSLATGYAFSELFGVAARGEYLLDDANFDRGALDRWKLFTFTLTADFKPLPHIPNLILRWDNRWEESNQDIFGGSAKRTADTADDSYEDVWFESVVGVVVTSLP